MLKKFLNKKDKRDSSSSSSSSDDEDESNSQPYVDIPDISIVPPSSQDHEYHSGEILKLLQVILQKDQKLAEKDKKIAHYQQLYWNLRKSNRHFKLRMAKKDKGIMPKKQKKQIAKDVLKATGRFSDAKLRTLK